MDYLTTSANLDIVLKLVTKTISPVSTKTQELTLGIKQSRAESDWQNYSRLEYTFATTRTIVKVVLPPQEYQSSRARSLRRAHIIKIIKIETASQNWLENSRNEKLSKAYLWYG